MPPIVSVVMPTYKRPQLLQRAIASVQSQTLTDWELIVSDDERPGGVAFSEVQELAKLDTRVRIVQHTGKPGQAGNLNNACSLAQGTWIKSLYDDDALKPTCLAEMVAAAQKHPQAALVVCKVDRYFNDKLRVSGRSFSPVPVRILQQNAAHISMLIQDADLGTPTQAMIHRRIFFECGVRFPINEKIPANTDTIWKSMVLSHGDLVEICTPLVDQHQGEHETYTSQMNDQTYFEEFYALREIFWEQIPADVKKAGYVDVQTDTGLQRVRVPSLEESQDLQKLIHVAVMAKRGRKLDAIRKAMTVWRPSAWIHFARWVRQQREPGLHLYVPRQTLT